MKKKKIKDDVKPVVFNLTLTTSEKNYDEARRLLKMFIDTGNSYTLTDFKVIKFEGSGGVR